MSVQITIEIPDEVDRELRHRAAATNTSIQALVIGAIKDSLRPRPSRPVTGPLVGKKGGKPAVGSPDRENPYDVLFS